jgi:micrococcal nuclease
MRQRTKTLLTSLLFVALALILDQLGVDMPTSEPTVPNTVTTTTTVQGQKITTSSTLVSKVIDGDTIELATGEKVRYIGVDTPETKHPTKGVECFGAEASAYNTKLVLGQMVRLEKDVSETDRYGRLLRYVYLEDGTFVNLKLVSEGYANPATFPPDVAYREVFAEAAKIARNQQLGLYKACQTN